MNHHHSRMRLGALALIVTCAAAVSLMAVPRTAHAQDDLDRVVASVDGDPITVHDLKTFAAINKVTLSDPGDMNSPETKSILKGVISERLLESEVKKYKDQIDDRQIDEYISNFEQSNGLTDAQVRAKVNISPDEVKAYYDAHPEEFSVGKETFKLAQILIAVPANATPAQVEAARVKADSIHK